MVDEQQNQVQFLLSDFNTRLKDIEERNRIIKERLILLGENLISTKEEINKDLELLKKTSNQMRRELDKTKTFAKSILSEIDNFVRKEEIIIIERMLKDFQPLKFARIEDVERMIQERKSSPSTKTKKRKNIKTRKTRK